MRSSSVGITQTTESELVDETMALISRTTATRGELLRLRDALKFLQNTMEILKMKRDDLATELNKLLNELTRREKVERQLMKIFTDLKMVLAILGYSTVSSAGSSTSKMKIEVNPISIMGVVVPQIMITEKPQINSIVNLCLYTLAEKLLILIPELLNVGQIEARIERIAYSFMVVNRKVNTLEKVIIPTYANQIKYIEGFLFDEDLENFARIKHIKDMSGRKET